VTKQEKLSVFIRKLKMKQFNKIFRTITLTLTIAAFVLVSFGACSNESALEPEAAESANLHFIQFESPQLYKGLM